MRPTHNAINVKWIVRRCSTKSFDQCAGACELGMLTLQFCLLISAVLEIALTPRAVTSTSGTIRQAILHSKSSHETSTREFKMGTSRIPRERRIRRFRDRCPQPLSSLNCAGRTPERPLGWKVGYSSKWNPNIGSLHRCTQERNGCTDRCTVGGVLAAPLPQSGDPNSSLDFLSRPKTTDKIRDIRIPIVDWKTSICHPG